MTDLVFIPNGAPRPNERLAAAAELAEFRAMGLRPAPRRQLARIEAGAVHSIRPYVSWPVFATVALQAAALVTLVVIQ